MKKIMSVGTVLMIFGAPANGEVVRIQQLMGTLCEIRAEGANRGQVNAAVSKAFEEIRRWDRVLSVYREDSEVARVHREAAKRPHVISSDLMAVLVASEGYWQATQGAFDPALGALSLLWRDQSDPPAGLLAHQKAAAGFDRIEINRTAGTIFLKNPEVRLDFGGIGKGWALDEAGKVLLEAGVDSAVLNFGGQILVVGKRSRPVFVEIRQPGKSKKILRKIPITTGSIATASQRERFTVHKGRRRGHILDPRTGEPVSFEGSITVIAPTATEADAWDTAILVLGVEKGMELIESSPARAIAAVPDGSRYQLVESKNFYQKK